MQYKKEFALSASCFLLALLCSMIWLNAGKENLAERISPHILRFHVIANSNSSKDQDVKLQVRTLILTELARFPELSDADNQLSDTLAATAHSAKESLCLYIQKNHNILEDKADALLASLGCPYTTQIRITKRYFPTKTYSDLVLPRGIYDAVQVSIGSARGRNWWCVVYPRLCFLDATHAILPDSSRQQLKNLIGEEDYSLLLDKGAIHFQVRFRLPEMLKNAFSDK